jgi:hypothetical protein
MFICLLAIYLWVLFLQDLVDSLYLIYKSPFGVIILFSSFFVVVFCRDF